MLTKKIFYIIVGIILSTVVVANLKYNQDQLTQFSQTNKCIGCDLTNADLYYGSVTNHSNCYLTNSNISSAYGSNMNFSYCDITNVSASNIDFSLCIMTYTNFSLGNFISARFSYANLDYANFTGAVVIDADFSNANLYKATITAEQLSSAKSVCNAILPDGSKGKCN